MGGNSVLLSDCTSSLSTLSAASNGLSLAISNISSVAKRVEDRFRELESKENELRQSSDRIAVKVLQIEEADRLLRAINVDLIQREKAVIDKEDAWKLTEQKLAANATGTQNIIYVNVGGQEFATSKATLLEFKGSFFEGLILSNDPQDNAQAKFFIDRDPKYFSAILNYMREGKLRKSDVKVADQDELKEEFDFYNIPFPRDHVLDIQTPTITSTSQAINSQQALDLSVISLAGSNDLITDLHKSKLHDSQLSDSLDSQNTTLTKSEKGANNKYKFEGGGTLLSIGQRDQIVKWIPHSNRIALLYKASRDGFGCKQFHEKCDNKGAVLTIIQSKNKDANTSFLFGGFAPDSIDSCGEFHHYANAFIFTLTNPHSIPPTKYALKRGNTAAVRCLANSSIVFGDGDIRVEDNSDTETSQIFFPASYFDTTNQRKLTFTGTRKFLTKEIEVYKVS